MSGPQPSTPEEDWAIDKWERVDARTGRLKVPGGWLYRVSGEHHGSTMAVAYVPVMESGVTDG